MKAKALTVKIAKNERGKACGRYESPRQNEKFSKTQPHHFLKAPIQCAELKLF